ncbi:aspartate--tRNA ligase [Striga asiatica]|uniref:aspartate--tRNA ligase n=1 Tax=Striga asiatica TaxID=4170 RepID=A0A5A7R2F6_STRAF|nr:aspartate--tRNA ligase [Striga asiatica]
MSSEEPSRKRKHQEATAASAAAVTIEADPLAANYGEIPFNDLQSKEISGKKWTEVKDLTAGLKVKDQEVLNRESIIDAEGIVSVPAQPITGTTQQAGEPLVCVNQDARLKYRDLDLRTRANQDIFRIKRQVQNIFRQFLLSEGFVEIHTLKLNKGTPACLAQAPQLHEQMFIYGGFARVFEIGPVFREEESSTHSDLCEFTGLDVEMEIKEHYSEVMDVVDRLFVAMFDSLNETCSKELEVINRQYPFQKLKYLGKTLRLTFEEGVRMLKEAGVEIDPLGDLNTESERKLGQLVLERYDTEFFILHRYPSGVRPFYTMPCDDNPNYSNSFDGFIRGEKIISGAQRVHVRELLTERAQACGIDVETISTYIDSFRYGAPPHGGFVVRLERVVMLFWALKNITKTSVFPRDPRRIAP